MAIPIRFAPVLEGDDALDFLERVEAMSEVPDPTYPSEERLQELKQFFKEQMLRSIHEKFDV